MPCVLALRNPGLANTFPVPCETPPIGRSCKETWVEKQSKVTPEFITGLHLSLLPVKDKTGKNCSKNSRAGALYLPTLFYLEGMVTMRRNAGIAVV